MRASQQHGVSWPAPWFVLPARLWALVSVRVRLMGACNVTTVTKPRAISCFFGWLWVFFLAFSLSKASTLGFNILDFYGEILWWLPAV